MKRLPALVVCAAVVLVLGCSQRYQKRVDSTLAQMKKQQRLDQFTNPPETGPFQELSVFLRPPKPLTRAQGNPGLPSVDVGAYDLVATFLDSSGEPTPARLYVLARVKAPKKPAAKKGEPPPPPPSPRGDFVNDVRALLASDFGNGDVLDPVKAPVKADKKGLNDFRKMVFQASNQDNVRVYFLKQDAHDVALIWDMPAAAEKAIAAGVELTLESFAVGARAQNKFQGGTDEDAGAAEGDESAASQAF